MRRVIVATVIVLLAFFATISGAAAQMMGGMSALDDHTAREEAEGKGIWGKLQEKQITCTDLSDENFEALGEYFMGQMMGSSHSAMNQMMINMMGEEGEEQMHIVIGKRLSGCDTSAAFPPQGLGFVPMMQMMGGDTSMGWHNLVQGTRWWGGGVGSWLVPVFFLVWAVVGIFVVIWLWKQITKN